MEEDSDELNTFSLNERLQPNTKIKKTRICEIQNIINSSIHRIQTHRKKQGRNDGKRSVNNRA